MKLRKKYRMYRRNGVYYIQNNDTGKQESLATKDRATAEQKFNAKNDAVRQPMLNLEIARTYLRASDPEICTRTWQYVMDKIVEQKEATIRELQRVNDTSADEKERKVSA